jgi:transposase
MSLPQPPIFQVPQATARVAQAILPKGNIYMRLRDTRGTVYEEEQFVDLFSHTGQPAESPVRLTLVSILQYVEGLTDRQAADAVRSRIDWKYLLGLELEDAGFHHSVLSEFVHGC